MDSRGPLLLAFVMFVLLGFGGTLGGCDAPSVYLGPDDATDAGDATADASADAGADDGGHRDAKPDNGPETAAADDGPEARPDTATDALDAPDAAVDAGPDVTVPDVTPADTPTDTLTVPDGPCGIPGSACCGALCGSGATCAEGRCVACGSAGAPCCGVLCGGGLECVSGACRAACAASETRCGGGCTNTTTSNDHCGGCGRSCAAAEVCTAGACVPRCVAPMLYCGGACVRAQTDPAHCGACGRACAAGEACVAGVCRGPFRGVVEDFEAGAWTTPPWMDTGVQLRPGTSRYTASTHTECAHDGLRGGEDSETYRVRPDVIVGFPGQRVSAWVRYRNGVDAGRSIGSLLYLGVSYGGGAWLLTVPSTRTGMYLDRAPGWSGRERIDYREGVPRDLDWFRVELVFAAGPMLTARILDSTGTTQIATLTVSVPEFTPGPLVVSADWVCVDTVTVSGP